MFNRFKLAALALLLTTLNSQLSTCFAQGALTPPGAPAPTMKTLAQIEPRIAVQTLAGDATAQFLISQPGSYYLTGNLTGVVAKAVIAINADNVHLDLGGHMLTGVVGAPRGIEIRGGRVQLVIENGSIRGFDSAGISAASIQKDVRIERVSVAAISAGSGITLSSGSTAVLIRGCSISDIVGGGGIVISSSRGAVEHCVVTDCSGSGAIIGIQAQNVTDCDVSSISGTGATGCVGISAQVANRCTVSSVAATAGGSATGIAATSVAGCHVGTVSAGIASATGIFGSTVEECSVSSVNASSGGDCIGISTSVTSNCRVSSIGNSGTSWGDATGIIASTAQGCSASSIGGSGSSNSPTGINAHTAANCHVSSIGSSSSEAGAVGISGSTISGCTVSVVAGGSTGSVTGIDADNVSQCGVSSVSLAGGPFNCSGIMADVISDCRVSVLSCSGTGNVVGLIGYRLARDCVVTTLAAVGGDRLGAATSQAGRTEGVAIVGSTDIAISVGSGQTIIGCTTSTAVTGILAIGTRNVIDGNNLTGSGTTGISVTSGANTGSALVIRNQIRSYTVNFDLDTPCQSGPVISATGAIAAGANPWANFTD